MKQTYRGWQSALWGMSLICRVRRYAVSRLTQGNLKKPRGISFPSLFYQQNFTQMVEHSWDSKAEWMLVCGAKKTRAEPLCALSPEHLSKLAGISRASMPPLTALKKKKRESPKISSFILEVSDSIKTPMGGNKISTLFHRQYKLTS